MITAEDQDLHCSRGPVSSMRGSREHVAEGVVHCDDHADRWAAYRVQGETDSFGCEYLLLCAECAEAVRLQDMMEQDGYCDLHKGEGSDVRDWRDLDEGSAGPVYRACKACRTRINRSYAEEADLYYDDRDYDPIETCEDDRDEPESDPQMPVWRPQRVREASKRMLKLAKHMAINGANPTTTPYQGATLRACIRHWHDWGAFDYDSME